MSGPFPGMDPWLENPRIWSGVHQRFITYIADALQPQLGRRYVAAVEERVYVASTDRTIIPDVSVRSGLANQKDRATTAILEPDVAAIVEFAEDEVREAYIEILDLQAGEEIVTVIEVLSPSNKDPGDGRDLYLGKQREVLKSKANLVEIDCLRSGPYVVSVPEPDVLKAGRFDYMVAVSRARDRDKRSFFYSRTIRDELPRIAIPLRPDDADVTLDLQVVFDRIFEAGLYGDRIDYRQPCIPRLRPDDEAWAQERIASWQAARQA